MHIVHTYTCTMHIVHTYNCIDMSIHTQTCLRICTHIYMHIVHTQCAMYVSVYAPCTINTCTCKQTANYKQLEVCSHVWLHMLCACMCKLHVFFNVSWIVSHTSGTKLCDQTSTLVQTMWHDLHALSMQTCMHWACIANHEMLRGIASHHQQSLELARQLCGCHHHKVLSLPYPQPSSSLHLGQSHQHWW